MAGELGEVEGGVTRVGCFFLAVGIGAVVWGLDGGGGGWCLWWVGGGKEKLMLCGAAGGRCRANGRCERSSNANAIRGGRTLLGLLRKTKAKANAPGHARG